MPNDETVRELDVRLRNWQKAYSICLEKESQLKALAAMMTGPEAELLTSMIQREAEDCERIKQRISTTISELVIARDAMQREE